MVTGQWDNESPRALNGRVLAQAQLALDFYRGNGAVRELLDKLGDFPVNIVLGPKNLEDTEYLVGQVELVRTIPDYANHYALGELENQLRGIITAIHSM